VRGSDDRVFDALTLSDCATLVNEEIATGGMRAKLEAAMDALSRGVKQVVIAPGAVDGIVQHLASGQHIGTRLVA
jgi:acetylglutamate kinase